MATQLVVDSTRSWALAILKANGWTGKESSVRRVVLDLRVGDPAVAYVETYGNTATFEIVVGGDVPVKVVKLAEP